MRVAVQLAAAFDLASFARGCCVRFFGSCACACPCVLFSFPCDFVVVVARQDEWGEHFGGRTRGSEEGVKETEVYEVHTTGAAGMQAAVDTGMGDGHVHDRRHSVHSHRGYYTVSVELCGGNRAQV